VYNYTYNGLEQLVIRAQVSPATTTHFIHDRMGNVIAETAGGGATGTTGTTREYIYLYEAEIAPTMDSRTVVDRPLAVVNAVNTATPATYWVSVDHLNRPVKMTTATKASVWDAIWQPWGGVHSLIVTGTAVFDARFPGQWFQTETGLHYNWHRSYDPTLGRYTQPDPLGFVDGPSVYGYAKGSPQRWVDRDGQNAGTAIGVAIAGPAGAIIGSAAFYCAIYPDKCRKILKQCMTVFNQSSADDEPKDLPKTDETGKVHGPIPDTIPEDAKEEKLKELKEDLEKSIVVRKQEQTRLGEDGPHRDRIRREEILLRQIKKRLSGS
jgi:RHS repeat-associated protein